MKYGQANWFFSHVEMVGTGNCNQLPEVWPVLCGASAPGRGDCSNLVGGDCDCSRHTMDRIAALNEILTENPKDAFARYGLAMEYSKQGDLDRALAEFSILLEGFPDYTAGYFMAAQTLVKAERVDDAKKMLQDGIASARRTGNLHAQSEMEAMLAELG